MKGVWLIALVGLIGMAPDGYGAVGDIDPYAVVHRDSRLSAAGHPGSKVRTVHDEGQWVAVGHNPRFYLQFTDVMDNTGIGFDDPVDGQSMQGVAIAAFELVSQILAGEPGSAHIRIGSSSPYLQENSLAVGVPYFACAPGFQRPIIFDALRDDVHLHEIEGELAVNFAMPLSDSLDPPAPGEYDLFSVIFHEITHILGFVGFSVEADGLPRDCGGARMLPAVARLATNGAGEPLWMESGGEIVFTGQPEDLPSVQHQLCLHLPGDAPDHILHLASDDLRVSGHWLREDFASRHDVLMLWDPLTTGETRRNMTPETKAVLGSALEYRVNERLLGLTGSWYDPGSSGQGFSLHFTTPDQFVVYFYGFRNNGDRLWMIGVHDGGVALGRELAVDLFEVTGGSFTAFDSRDVTEAPWGQLVIRFQDCLSAVATLAGLDGQQDLDLTRLAGVEGLECF